ncbi:MAG TPA: amino acid--[acyl-carrier-protein] ligase [Micropepsaceae bacterium]|nr:amino acid--[acyl-carrier-protein] ligase [Micropepsaceae bacterium]
MNLGLASTLKSQAAWDSIVYQLLCPTGVEGVYARTGLFERIVDGISSLISRHREPGTEVFRFPPVMSRRVLERSGYLESFPHLLGCVSCLKGSEAEISRVVDCFEGGADWTQSLAPADLVLSPASCYPAYPLAAERGIVPSEGLLFDVAGDCFRHEPSRDIDRMQSFRMREFVCIGTPDQVAKFRQRWMAQMTSIAEELRLSYRVAPASDPFFGRGGIFMARTQVEKSLKFELLVPIGEKAVPTACMSLNYHRDHFGNVWALRNADGEISHTSCVAFGMDRLAIALFATHGVNLADWPISLRATLRLES